MITFHQCGIRISWPDWENEFNMKLNYNMDYLFGGTTALLSQIAARNASAYYEQTTYAATQSALIQLAAAGRALKEANKKRSGKTNDFGLSIEKEEERNGDSVNSKRFVT